MYEHLEENFLFSVHKINCYYNFKCYYPLDLTLENRRLHFHFLDKSVTPVAVSMWETTHHNLPKIVACSAVQQCNKALQCLRKPCSKTEQQEQSWPPHNLLQYICNGILFKNQVPILSEKTIHISDVKLPNFGKNGHKYANKYIYFLIQINQCSRLGTSSYYVSLESIVICSDSHSNLPPKNTAPYLQSLHAVIVCTLL